MDTLEAIQLKTKNKMDRGHAAFEHKLQYTKGGKPRQPRYNFLSKQDKEIFNHTNVEWLCRWLEHGDYDMFNRVIGWLQDYKDICGEEQLSEDHKKCLKLSLVMFEAVGSGK
jgi:hypothetical protein